MPSPAAADDGRRGRFVVFEGIDASGKSTQVARLAAALRQAGRSVHVTAEPTTGPVGTMIREAFAGRVPLDDRAVAALFVADRIDHLTNPRDGILAILDDGVDVVGDRYHLSSLAYQAGDVGMDWILRANAPSTDLLRPDVTIYLDLDPAVAMQRLRRRAEPADRFEVLERLASAHAHYAEAIALLAERDTIRTVSALGEPDEVSARVMAAVRDDLGL